MKLKKIISKALIIGILFNNLGYSFANTKIVDERYETFEGNNITINNILEEDKTDIKIEGNTIVNLMDNNNIHNKNSWIKLEDGYLRKDSGSYLDLIPLNIKSYKPNTTYTFIIDIKNNNSTNNIRIVPNDNRIITSYVSTTTINSTGRTIGTFETISDFTDKTFVLYLSSSRQLNGSMDIRLQIFEGDLTQNPPTEYIEGIKSSFENQLITQEMIDNREEKQENLGKYKVDIKATGKNKFNGEINENRAWGINSIKLYDSLGINSSNFIKVKPNTSYVLTYNGEKIFGNLHFRDINGNFISQVYTQSPTIVTPDNCEYFSFQYDSQYFGIDNIQLEEGSVATPYEPYRESINTFYLNSPLLEGDTIEYINGQAYHVRRGGKILLDENKNWGINNVPQQDQNHMRFSHSPSGYKLITDTNVICDKFPSNGDILTAETIFTYNNGADNGVYVISISRSKLDTEDIYGFRKWISENPVTVVYELENPIYEPIKSDLSVQLFETTTHISNNSNIPANMEITVDRTINKATEAIELAKENPTLENLSKARMWINLLKESTNKDNLHNQINDITEIEDLTIEPKKASSSLDVYVKSKNSLTMTLSTNSIIFDNFTGVDDMEKLNAVNLTVNSSLPYRLNSYLMSELKNNDNTKVIPKELLNIRLNGESDYKAFTNINEKLVLKEDCERGNNNQFNIDLILKGSLTHKADVYKTTIKFEAEQK